MQPKDASLIYHDSPLRLKSFNESISPVYYTPVLGEKLSAIVKMVDELGASTDMSSIEHFSKPCCHVLGPIRRFCFESFVVTGKI